MFQKEMAERIIGKFGTSKYGRLSIITNFRLNILNKFNISPNCFFPKPKINSTVIFFKPHNKIYNIKDIENLEKVTNIFFSNKRKMINKNVNKIFKNFKNLELIKNLNLKARPQELEPQKYYEITELFEKI
jgi:16S rRNA (adenine1518-N6/adenine1519-N6)-dimethyltransferase